MTTQPEPTPAELLTRVDEVLALVAAAMQLKEAQG